MDEYHTKKCPFYQELICKRKQKRYFEVFITFSETVRIGVRPVEDEYHNLPPPLITILHHVSVDDNILQLLLLITKHKLSTSDNSFPCVLS